MLAVYLSVFGASILGLLKPLVALVTTISVAVSAVVILRRSRSSSCALCEASVPSSAPGPVGPKSHLPEPRL